MAKKLFFQNDLSCSVDGLKSLTEQLREVACQLQAHDFCYVLLRDGICVDRVVACGDVPKVLSMYFEPGKRLSFSHYSSEVPFEFSTPDGQKWWAISSVLEGDSWSLMAVFPQSYDSRLAEMLFTLMLQLVHERMMGIQMQQNIENNNSFTFAIMNSLRFGVIAIDLEGHILYANDTACVMVNIRRRDLLLIPIHQLVQGWAAISESVVAGVKFQNEEVPVMTADAVARFNINVSPINDLSGHLLGMVVSLREIENLYEIVNKYTGMQARYTFDDVVGKSKEMRRLVDYARTIADSPSTVLIEGESGTGKEVFAQSIHNGSSRRDAGFVAINCAAIPENLIESELFGYDDGAFTGAKKGGHPGKFELAHKGTLFLDEIGEMKADMQAKLLRAIQEGAVMRIGGTKLIPVDVRIIAATNKNLKREVEKGLFRLDLFYRLSVIPLKLPPLRQRKSDLPSLIRLLMQKKSLRLHKNIPHLHYSEFQQMLDYAWPGNIRELENFIEQLVNLDGKFSFDYFKQQMTDSYHSTVMADADEYRVGGFIPCSMDELEKEHIKKMIDHCSGNMSQVARLLGVSRNTLYLKMKKYELVR
ncbi:transcriptional regulator with PAS, ATPase and Fis domain [Breznakibacter xylanolyticus]|uniref:Transcriptional regulator with PAS, ATPase and Fis domain n=1 Tax=Breznakibacter xylanolyticus TaxID=990 RepID=A0A2W7MVX2_9BACT|nr:sigma 54-interacting transcriptional regulator [Breznakibacter xylanolyticus]PZX12315.1 transcriptional regulator with PAS, ATPase and Fis domain [Breznakibacter xylanolyticus]